MNSTHALHFDKYKAIDGTYFGFEIFDEIFKVINERKSTIALYPDSHLFEAGVDSAEAAVRRLREEYYEAISKSIMDI
jgi:hypothetical protein